MDTYRIGLSWSFSISSLSLWLWIQPGVFSTYGANALTSRIRVQFFPLISCFGFVVSQPVIYYLVKWCSLPYEDSTWELKEDVDEGKIREFKRIQSRHPELKRVVGTCGRR